MKENLQHITENFSTEGAVGLSNQVGTLTIRRIWAMPNKWTFTIKPIRELLQKYSVGVGWVDPFAGENSPAEFTNDLNPNRKANCHFDGLTYLRNIKTAKGILFDPPYSFTQAKQCYDDYGKNLFEHNIKPTMMNYWSECKNEMARAIEPEGLAICFGWNTNGLGLKRGFKLIEILIVAHGGHKNDTLVTVEEKQAGLFDSV
jgi:hypothetical protein